MAQAGTFYDLGLLKSIPILEVCQTLGIPVTTRGNKPWCKLRDEKEPSALLHPENNTFYDFGMSSGGDNIALVSVYLNVDRKTGIERLATAFGIAPQNPRKGFESGILTNWEYAQIGLHGDLATKNFTFDIERQGIERVSELSAKYGMSMNDLKKKQGPIFKKLLLDKAIPFVRDLRNEYYLEIFARYSMFKEMGTPDPHLDPDCLKLIDVDGQITSQIQRLQNAERILNRACEGTTISPRPVREYDISADICKILSGEIKPTLGTTDYPGIQQAAKENNTTIKYQTVDYCKYMGADLGENEIGIQRFVHSAFIKEGKVVVGYLECDREAIKPLLDAMKLPVKKKLDEQIGSAKKQAASAGHSTGKGKSVTGEGR